eukprot:TRINITY_DN12392_c0_g4_i1.p1 TRINITY_DN12392_c0_g4~~TRINITY_DN12392_c0_g4_i1.p1  ORF type:complete len:221 (-),score=38.32 TRINITY_DN12392_c0_g4_i1:181-747(-)
MAAVRALSNKVPTPNFRRSFSMQQRNTSEVSKGKDKMMDGIVFEDEGAEQPSFDVRATTYESAFSDARLLEGDVYSDNVQEDSDNEDESSEVSGPIQVASRTWTLACDHEFPDMSTYLDPEWIKKYNELYFSDDVGPDDQSDYAEESDTDEMYSGPLQPCRTTARRDFPHATSYLSKEELVDLWSGFS